MCGGRFRLDHRFGQLGLGESPNRPAWRVSAAAEALHVEGPARVVAFWQSVVETLIGGPAMLMVSRLDVHADFAGLGIADADRSGFVCRSPRQSVEFTDGNLETLYWGKGGEVTVRVYDKLAEVKATGKGGYLLDAYAAAGFTDGDQVQRVEAQVRREPLRQLGVATAQDALDQGGAVYAYVVNKWLRLTESRVGFSTRTRRPGPALAGCPARQGGCRAGPCGAWAARTAHTRPGHRRPGTGGVPGPRRASKRAD